MFLIVMNGTPVADSEGFVLRFHNRASAQHHALMNRLDGASVIQHFIPEGTKLREQN